MSVPLLTTKLFVPPVRSELVPRPRLLERLNTGCQRKLTLVCAPAGFGKTTLLAQWIREARLPVAWVTLDASDNEPTQFWTYLITALDRLRPGVGETALALLQAPQPIPVETLLTALINDVTVTMQEQDDDSARQNSPHVLVLDDYHMIEAQPIHTGLVFLIEHLPPGLHLVIATRADPPLSQASLRARGQLVELRPADLRFTRSEAASFLNQAMSLDLSVQDVADLENSTEGWIAGLHLAALALQSIPVGAERTRFVRSFSGGHRYVLDYLVEEVLSRQPAHVRSFLQETSLLERLTASLCDAVTRRDDSQAMLAALEQASLFLMPLDDERCWYRYHHLFADLLRVRGQDDADLVERHRLAADWYQARGFAEDAFGHWLQAGAHADAATLVETQALVQLNQGQTALVLAWIERLPPDLVASRPWLLVFRGWGCLLSGQAMAVHSCLQQAQQAAAEMPSVDSELTGHVAAIQAYLAALQGDVATTIAQAERALAYLSPQSLTIRSVVAFVLGGMYLLTGDLAAARSTFADAAQMGQAAGNHQAAVPAWCAVASLQSTQGELRQAEATYRRALDLATTAKGRPLPLAAQPYGGLAEIAYERNDLDAAGEWLDASLELCRKESNPETRISTLLTQATLLLAQGDPGAATAACEEALAEADRAQIDPLSESHVAARRIELLLASGNVSAAARLADSRDLAADDPVSFFHEAEHVALARILLAQGRTEKAQALLARLISAARNDGRVASLIKLLTLRALAYQAQRKTETACHSLSHALSLAEVEGFVRTFLDEGQPLASLLQQLAPMPYRDQLLAAFGLEATGQVILLIEPLSERELEVLNLIAAGHSNQAIAEELVVALGTVKSHSAAIYRKLDVKSRTQAVARARELGLLDRSPSFP